MYNITVFDDHSKHPLSRGITLSFKGVTILSKPSSVEDEGVCVPSHLKDKLVFTVICCWFSTFQDESKSHQLLKNAMKFPQLSMKQGLLQWNSTFE